LTEEQELRVAKKMLRECDKKLINQEAVEKDPALFNELKTLYEGIIADVKSDLIIQAPNDEAHTGIMHKLTATELLFDSINSFGLGDVVKAKTPGEDMYFEGVIIEHMVKRDGTEMVLVDFGEGEVELCMAADCVKVMKGTFIEVGDKVQAQPEGEFNFYEGVVTSICNGPPPDFEPLYTVAYFDCDDVDENLPASSVRKVESGRVSLNRFKRAVNKVKILNNMAKASASFQARKSEVNTNAVDALVKSTQEAKDEAPAEETKEGGGESKEEAKEA